MIKNIWIPLLILISSNFIQAQELTAIDALNKASYQRMLTQKMLNAYLKIGSNLDVTNAKKDMEVSAAKFEELMLELFDYEPNPEVVEAIEQIQASWRIYSLKVLSYPNKTMGGVLLKMSGKMLREYDDLLILLEEQAIIEQARLINLSGRQAMLSQRLEMLYLAQNWGLSSKEIDKELKNTNQEFEATQNTLFSAKINMPQIVDRLNNTIEIWRFLMEKFGNVPSPLAILDMTSSVQEKLLQTAAMYTELTKQIKLDNENEEEKE